MFIDTIKKNSIEEMTLVEYQIMGLWLEKHVISSTEFRVLAQYISVQSR